MARAVLLLTLVACITSYASTDDSKKTDLAAEDQKNEIKVPFGYRLPGNLFNDGKPFYVEKDPVTGQFDFETKTSPSYDVSKDKTQHSLSDAPVERTDTDTNEVTFYDFLNLPVKYTSSKYVYPLISSSYANTKLQGNGQSGANNIYNHKLDVTERPITQRPNYYNHKILSTTQNYYKNVVTTTPKPTTTRAPTVSTKSTTIKPKLTTTERTMSLFEQLFGSYDEMTTDKIEEEYSDNDNDLVQSQSEIRDQITPSTTLAPLRTTTKATTTTVKTTQPPTKMITTTQPTTTTTTVRTTTSTRSSLNVQPISTIAAKVESRPISTVHTTTSTTPTPTTIKQIRTTTTRPLEVNHPAIITRYPLINRPTAQTNFVLTSAATTSQRPTTATPTSKPQQQYQTQYQSQQHQAQLQLQQQQMQSQAQYQMQQQKQSQAHLHMQSQAQLQTQSQTQSQQQFSSAIGQQSQYQLVTSMPLGEFDVKDVQPTKPQILFEQPESNDQYVQMSVQMGNQVQPNSHNTQSFATNNIVIPPGQNSVSFIVRNQQSVDGGQFTGSASKESLYPNRPNQPHHLQLQGEMVVSSQQDNSLRLPVTTSGMIREGQVFPAKTESDNEIQSKVVFPKPATNLIRDQTPVPTKQIPIVNDDIDLVPPPPSEPIYAQQNTGHNNNQKEILQLIGQPLYHQIPKDITSNEKLHRRPEGVGNFRPPWDPRPGHFQMGKPDYSRPLRTGGPPSITSRISEAYPLPNILPQFRPNSRTSYVDYWEDRHPGQHVHYPPRQPIGYPNRPYHEFYEKANRPPMSYGDQAERGPNKRIGRPEISMSLYDLPKTNPNYPEVNRRHSVYRNDDGPAKVRGPQPYFYERMYEALVPKPTMEIKETLSKTADEYAILKAPPVVPITVARQEENTPETVVTLQMIQSKQMAKEIDGTQKIDYPPKLNSDSKLSPEEKRQVYVVYPVNSTPIKLASKQPNKVGMIVTTHGTMNPVVSSDMIKEDFTNTPFTITHEKQKPLLIVRQKGELQKVANKIKSSFPYPLENPEADTLASEVALPTEQNTLFTTNQIISKIDRDNDVWSLGNSPPKHTSDPLREADRFDLLPPDESSEKPIAIAYTATGRPELKATPSGEHRPSFGKVDNNGGSEFTVSAVMHTLSRAPQQGTVLDVAPNQDFHAPFQASENIGAKPAEGWTVVGNKKPEPEASITEKQDKKESDEEDEDKSTTDAQFAFEHFKPQLFGGFKPIYKLPTPNQNLSEEMTTQSSGRLERRAI